MAVNEIPYFRPEQVDHDIARVDEYPVALRLAFRQDRPGAGRFGRAEDAFDPGIGQAGPIEPGGEQRATIRPESVGVELEFERFSGSRADFDELYPPGFFAHREAFAIDTTRSENGIHYLPAPRKPETSAPVTDGATGPKGERKGK